MATVDPSAERFVGSWFSLAKITIVPNRDGTGAWVYNRRGPPGRCKQQSRCSGPSGSRRSRHARLVRVSIAEPPRRSIIVGAALAVKSRGPSCARRCRAVHPGRAHRAAGSSRAPERSSTRTARAQCPHRAIGPGHWRALGGFESLERNLNMESSKEWVRSVALAGYSLFNECFLALCGLSTRLQRHSTLKDNNG